MVKRNNSSIITILRRYSKVITAFLVVNFITSLVYPMASFALTAGPTMPEYTGFEPVDAGNMVDLNTGDFSYNIPLMEVPGPSGSYPVSMSYHAGISPNDEASWVGLGWSLNPGAINRSVSGYPDDWKDASSFTKEFWEGGETKRFKRGVNVPFKGLNFSGSMSLVQDTYRGTGLGYSFGVSAGPKINDRLGLTAGWVFADDPVAGPSFTVHAGPTFSYFEGTSVANVTNSLTYSSTYTTHGVSKGIRGSVSVSVASRSILDASISSRSSGVGFSTLGGSSVGRSAHLHTSGKRTNDNQQYKLSLYGRTWEYSVNEYFIDEHQNDLINGSLYPHEGLTALSSFDNHDYDIIDIYESSDALNPSDKINKHEFGLGNEMMMGGTVPAYDSYMVLGQGIGGVVQPYNFLQNLKRQNKKNEYDNYILKQYEATFFESNSTEKTEFRFQGQLNNKFIYDADNSHKVTQGASVHPITYEFHDWEIDSDPAITIDKHQNKLAQADNVDWLKNSELLGTTNALGLMESENLGFVRENDEKIGGFLVTSASGVKYHYSLPVYSKQEYHYMENVNQSEDGKFTNETTKSDPYAYTWLLSGMTGPDYVDRGAGANLDQPNGILDEHDWGYWVAFDYGLWTGLYSWRTPAQGFEEDFDGDFKSFSRGLKEIYYLNKIRTATHTALFIKELRLDGKSLALNTNLASSFFPVEAGGQVVNPISTLKLSEIMLFDNEDLGSIDYTFQEYLNVYGHHGDNVLLKHNLSNPIETDDNSLRTIEFDTSYDLMPETPNSFTNIYLGDGSGGEGPAPTGENGESSPIVGPFPLNGKLTLDKINTYGKGRISHIPPMEFEYENENEPYCKDCIDYWGNYKSDYDPNIADRNVAMMPSSQSSNKIDSWSLNQILSSLGGVINIDYGADDFSQTTASVNVNVPIKDVITTGDGTYNVYFDESIDLSINFEVGQNIDMFLLVGDAFRKLWNIVPNDVIQFKIRDIQTYYGSSVIQSINSDHIVVQHSVGDVISHELPYYHHDPGIPGNLDAALIGCSVGVPIGGGRNDYLDFLGGEAYVPIKDNFVGGGLRVNKVGVSDPGSGRTQNIIYDYTEPGSTVSSGQTSYLPVNLYPFNIKYPDHYYDAVEGWYTGGELCQGTFLENLLNYLDNGFTLVPSVLIARSFDVFDRTSIVKYFNLNVSANENHVRFKQAKIFEELRAESGIIRPPGVLYSNVTVREEIDDGAEIHSKNNYNVYSFHKGEGSFYETKTLHLKDSVVRDESKDGDLYHQSFTRGISQRHILGVEGSAISHELYDKNGELLTRTDYHYLHDELVANESFLTNYAALIESQFGSIGVFDEQFISSRYIPETEIEYEENDENRIKYEHDLVGTLLKRSSYPVVRLGQTTTDFRKGHVESQSVLNYDFYTGQPTRTLSLDNHGNYIGTEVIPAYALDDMNEYPDFGPIAHGSGKKNLLSQEGASFTYRMADNFDPSTDAFNSSIVGLLSGSLQTWNNTTNVLRSGDNIGTSILQPDVYRKSANYQFIGNSITSPRPDGSYPLTDISQLLNSIILDGSGNPDLLYGWQKNGEITLYDVNSHALEAMDINGNLAATKTDLDQNWVLSTVANASYSEFAFTGFEDGDNEGAGPVNYGGNIAQPSGQRLHAFGADGIEGTGDDIPTHTGLWSISPNTGAGVAYQGQLEANSTYRVLIWSTEENSVQFQVNIDGAGFNDIATNVLGRSDGWHLHEAIFSVDTGSPVVVEVQVRGIGTGPMYFDDFRMHPIDAAMTSYVYNEWGELSDVLDQNNLFTHYEYDETGRLKSITRETFNHGAVKVSETITNYARSNN